MNPEVESNNPPACATPPLQTALGMAVSAGTIFMNRIHFFGRDPYADIREEGRQMREEADDDFRRRKIGGQMTYDPKTDSHHVTLWRNRGHDWKYNNDGDKGERQSFNIRDGKITDAHHTDQNTGEHTQGFKRTKLPTRRQLEENDYDYYPQDREKKRPGCPLLILGLGTILATAITLFATNRATSNTLGDIDRHIL